MQGRVLRKCIHIMQTISIQLFLFTADLKMPRMDFRVAGDSLMPSADFIGLFGPLSKLVSLYETLD